MYLITICFSQDERLTPAPMIVATTAIVLGEPVLAIPGGWRPKTAAVETSVS